MKKSFSLLETIFVIVLISIIALIAFPKLFLNITNTTLVKVKSDVSLIRNAIVQNRNQNIISGKGEAYISQLDSAKIDTDNEKLFIGVENDSLLEYPVISTSKNNREIGKWIKASTYDYEIYINKVESIKFIYDVQSGTFDCDYEQDSCKDFMK